MGIDWDEPDTLPAPPSRAMAKVLASVLMVFVVVVVAAIGWSALRHDIVFEGVIDNGPDLAAAPKAKAKDQPAKGDGYSTWSDRHGAGALAPADDLLKPLPQPYSYERYIPLEQCVCQSLEAWFGDAADDIEARVVHGRNDRPVAFVVAVRTSDTIPKSVRRLRPEDLALAEQHSGVSLHTSSVRGKAVVVFEGRPRVLQRIGTDSILAVVASRPRDARRIMSALLAR